MLNVLVLFLLSGLIVANVAAQNLTTVKETNKNQIEVPFKLDRHLVVIKGKINNNDEVDFIFDTGTTGVVLSETFADKYQLKGKALRQCEVLMGICRNRSEILRYPSLDSTV